MVLYCYHGDAVEVSPARMTNDRTTDIDVVFETTWTCISLGAILHRTLELFERSCTGVVSLKMFSKRYPID